MAKGWIGVDLDRTLATYESGQAVAIGKPITAMVDRVKAWRKAGIEVRIFTARGTFIEEFREEYGDGSMWNVAAQTKLVQDWCLEHIGEVLPVTGSKDFEMICLYDDRAVAVEPNTGKLLSPDLAAS